jgi:amidase
VDSYDRIADGLRSCCQALFRNIDVIVCRPMPTTAFPHDHSLERTGQLDVDGEKIPYYHQLAWPAVATLTGRPATAAPIGDDASGLPIVVQIIGGYLNDRTMIAGVIEREFGGFTPPPNQ